MFYNFAIEVAANTTKASPTTQHLKLTEGIITKFLIQFPVGCAGLAHCAIDWEGAQLIPHTRDQSLASDGFVIPIDEEVDLGKRSHVLLARCWNTDDTYAHTITIMVNVLRGKAAMATYRILEGLGKFLRMVGVKV